MSESMRMTAEIGFNVLYLIGIWWLVAKMIRKKDQVSADDQQIAGYFRWAFLLLAAGDTGHVGFRVLAYALGGLETRLSLFGISLPLVGIGALSTAYTVTVFYMFIVAIWKVRFNKKPMSAYIGFQVVGVARLIIMLWPQNEWANVVPPSTWSLYRNIPLIVVGLGLATHMLMDNAKVRDKFYTWLAVLIYISFAFYLPVILWVQEVPLLGMLMIPKTLAYIVMAVMVYKRFYSEK